MILSDSDSAGVRPVMKASNGKALVLLGTFGGPAAQWLVFWLVARSSGAASAGQFALVLALGTFVFAAANLGLRDTYVTLINRYPFVVYFWLRTLTTFAAAAVHFVVCEILGLPTVLAMLVAVQKSADAIADILFGRLQRQRKLIRYGVGLIVNGTSSAVLAVLAVLLTSDGVFAVAGSAAGSVITLGVVASMVGYASDRRATKSETEHSSFRTDATHVLRGTWAVGVWQLVAVAIINFPTWVVGWAGDASSVGVFAAVAYMLTIGSLVGTALNYAFLGDYRYLYSNKGVLEMTNLVKTHSRNVALLGLGAVVVVAIVGPWAVEFLYGPDFVPHRASLIILAAAAALNPVSQLLNAGLMVLNKYRTQMLISLVALGVMMIVCLVMQLAAMDAVLLGCLVALAGSVTKLVFALDAFRRSIESGGQVR